MQAKKLLLTFVLVIGAGISGAAQTRSTQAPAAENRASAQVSPDTQNQNNATQRTANLPSTGSALPLLSVIGFGVLVGGIASALKTR